MRLYTNVLIFFLAIVLLGCYDDSFDPKGDFVNPVVEFEVIREYLDLEIRPYDYASSSSARARIPNFNFRATIGRVLFYDESLSVDGSVSCASCHKQDLAFADDVKFSEGVHGNLTTRNSFALGSFRSLADEYYSQQETTTPSLFWDHRASSVRAQMIETLANPNEMGMELEDLVSAVQSKPYYQSLFAIHQNDINSDNILAFLQDFLSSINSEGSKFAMVEKRNSIFMTTDEPYSFTSSEHNGKLLFNKHCNNCHLISPLKQDPITGQITIRAFTRDMANNGLGKTYKDKGAGSRPEFAGNAEYNGLFKIPDLRNIAVTRPYMHDGRFNTLHDVVDHYSAGIINHRNLHELLKDDSGNPKKFKFTDQEKEDLISFLHTLTDPDMLNDEKWSDPFKR